MSDESAGREDVCEYQEQDFHNDLDLQQVFSADAAGVNPHIEFDDDTYDATLTPLGRQDPDSYRMIVLGWA